MINKIPSTNEKEEIISLNNKLFKEFTIQELEERFETDPLFLNTLFNIGALSLSCNSKGVSCITLQCGCNEEYGGGCACKKISACPILQCGCDSEYQ